MRIRTMAVTILVSAAALGQANPVGSRFASLMETSMRTMDQDMMSARENGDVDHDFTVMMVPHHEGAINMAKAELLYGHDPAMRRLAQEILVDQGSEIEAMQHWQKQHQSPGDDHAGK